ncbi:MAG: MFS transporter [Streptosporangiaceae bacterium]
MRDDSAAGSGAPRRPALTLTALILVATVANLNLAVANVALPTIGTAFDSSQITLDMIAVGYSFGLACSVLWLGAIGDRHGRKMMLIGGTLLAIPASLLAGYAPTDSVLGLARIIGGVAAGMAYPTTLALITALWSGQARTRAIALWSAIGGAMAALGPLLAGALLEHFWWGSAFLATLPFTVIALVMALRYVPSHVNETARPVDNLGGILSVVAVGSVVLAVNFAPIPDKATVTIGLGLIGLAALGGFFLRERRAASPLYDLAVARRRTFWVAACAGIIVFGALMGAMFVGQQFLQDVLGYSALDSGLAILPAAALMVLVAPRSANLVAARGSRFTLLTGYFFCLLGFLTMLLLWQRHTPYWEVALGYGFVGIGVGLAGTPASRSLTSSVPVPRAGMASGTADLQRDLGGAILQSIFGALLTAGYAASVSGKIADAPASTKQMITTRIQNELTKSFTSATAIARQYPRYSDQIIAAAKESFLAGDRWTYLGGIVAVLAGAAVVRLYFPTRQREQELIDGYHAADSAAAARPAGAVPTTAAGAATGPGDPAARPVESAPDRSRPGPRPR